MSFDTGQTAVADATYFAQAAFSHHAFAGQRLLIALEAQTADATFAAHAALIHGALASPHLLVAGGRFVVAVSRVSAIATGTPFGAFARTRVRLAQEGGVAVIVLVTIRSFFSGAIGTGPALRVADQPCGVRITTAAVRAGAAFRADALTHERLGIADGEVMALAFVTLAPQMTLVAATLEGRATRIVIARAVGSRGVSGAAFILRIASLAAGQGRKEQKCKQEKFSGVKDFVRHVTVSFSRFVVWLESGELPPSPSPRNRVWSRMKCPDSRYEVVKRSTVI